MTDKKKAYLRLLPVAVLFAALCVFAWVKPADDASLAERRPLAQMPALKGEDLLSGDFMVDFEDYATDQFPLREPFRKLQSFLQFRRLLCSIQRSIRQCRSTLTCMRFHTSTTTSTASAVTVSTAQATSMYRQRVQSLLVLT